MRIIFTLILLTAASSLTAQTSAPLDFMNYTQRTTFANNNLFKDSLANKKWFFSTYSGISTGFILSKGGNANYFSAPVALQLNRRLNNNLYAFAAASVAPTFVNFSNVFLSADLNKANPNNSFLKSNSLGLYTRADLGLVYINDAKTFSISGSIGIERSSYPVFPRRRINTPEQNTAVYPKQ